jgi:glycine/D-amino acid oxidase-like deaminating enzyme
MNKRVAVIGRGFGGLNIALKLIMNGFQVALFGKKDTYCASKAAIGVCSIKGIFEGNDELFRQKIAGHQELFMQLEWLASKNSLERSSGVTEVFSTRQHYQKQLGRIFRSDFYGLKGVAASALDGKLGQTLAITYPLDYAVDVENYRSVFESTLASLGVEIHDELVEEIQEHKEQAILIRQGNRLTDRFSLVVCAAGIGAKHILGINQEWFQTVSLVPGWTFYSSVSQKFEDHSSLPKAFVSGAHGMFVTREKLASFGSSSGSVSTWISDCTEAYPSNSDELSSEVMADRNQLEERFNCIYEFERRHTDANYGVRIRTKNRQPVCCWNSSSMRILLVFGFYKNGLTLAPLMANKVCLEVKRSLRDKIES